jgi:hypothetical protein
VATSFDGLGVRGPPKEIESQIELGPQRGDELPAIFDELESGGFVVKMRDGKVRTYESPELSRQGWTQVGTSSINREFE